MVTKNSGVEAIVGGLAVRWQGPHVVRAVAVQIVTRRGQRVEQVEHLGSAHTDAELALLLGTARERLNPGQGALDLGDVATVAPRVEDVADWTAGRRPGQATLDENLDQAGPSTTSKSSRSPGGRPASVNAGGRVVATSSVRDRIAKAFTAFSASTGGLSALVMYDCTALHFETSDEDTGPKALREVGMKRAPFPMNWKHRRYLIPGRGKAARSQCRST